MAGDRIYGDLTITDSKYGNLKVLFKNYEYMQAGKLGKDYIWLRCTCQKEHRCQARLKILREDPFTILEQSKHWHNHMPKHDAQLLADAALRMMTTAAAATTDSYATIYARCSAACTVQVRKFIKRKELCKAAMARARKKHGRAEPTTLNDLVLEGELRQTVDGEDWVLYEDPPEGEDRMFVLASDSMLRHFSGANVLMMDGMFEVPKLMYQLYTIHAVVGETTTPVAFAMLPKKDGRIYSKLLRKILEACDERGIDRPEPDAVVIDFELAAVKAVQEHFPDARISGCFFHLNQSVQRWVTQKLREDLKKDTDFSILLTKLVYLAYLRKPDIPAVWLSLLKNCNTPEERKLANYFGGAYVRGKKKKGGYSDPHFKLHIWNLHLAALYSEPTTNNFAEAWHRCIQVMLNDTDMSISSFIETLKLDMVTRDVRLEQIQLGIETPKRNTKSANKHARIRKILGDYDKKLPMEILDNLAYTVKLD